MKFVEYRLNGHSPTYMQGLLESRSINHIDPDRVSLDDEYEGERIFVYWEQEGNMENLLENIGASHAKGETRRRDQIVDTSEDRKEALAASD